jgi:hypothetical protein
MTTVIVIVLTTAAVITAFFTHIDIKIKDMKQDLKAEIAILRKEIKDCRKAIRNDNKALNDYIFAYMSEKAKNQ